MTISVKHKFQSSKSDNSDPSVIQPSNWNDGHNLTCAGNVVIGNSTSTSGAATEIPCTATGRALIAATSTTDVVSQLGSALTSTINAALPTGMIVAFGASSAPSSGWLVCNGSAVSRTTYSALFAVLSTTWGSGDGSTTFNLPDLRGVFLRGLDSGKGYDSSRSFATYQADNYPAHTHAITDPGHVHTYDRSASSGTYSAAVGVGAYPPGLSTSTTNTSNVKTGITATDSGGGTGTETRPKNVAVVYIIKT